MLTWQDAERRCAAGDRRHFSPATLYYGLLYGRRRQRRRQAGYLPAWASDWLPPQLLLLALAVFYLSLVDAALTLQLLQHGVRELNPLMRLLIHTHPLLFLGVKALLTAFCLVMLLVLRDCRVAGGRLRVGWLIPGALAAYGTLILYELFLFSSVLG